MLKKHIIAIVVTAILSIMAVIYMYSKNYISFESGLHITFAQEPDDGYVEKEFAPANVTPEVVENIPVSTVRVLPPSNETTKVNDGRFFDDMMKLLETIMPLATVLIPIYLMKKNKKTINNISYSSLNSMFETELPNNSLLLNKIRCRINQIKDKIW